MVDQVHVTAVVQKMEVLHQFLLVQVEILAQDFLLVTLVVEVHHPQVQEVVGEAVLVVLILTYLIQEHHRVQHRHHQNIMGYLHRIGLHWMSRKKKNKHI